jgi:putative protease
MEILSPAGSKESFVAAIKAGADSVYVGIKNFNARKNANNLNFYDLEVLTNYAHENNVKVYITFNTLIKHEEINDAVSAIDAFSRLKVDALIVQDLGIARIIKEYYPNINLHASTQLAVHNSLGVDALAAMDFKRVVLARELTFAELKTIKNHSSLELEIFAHGALCFCVSGMCLFSSVIGGYSGNRGLCTQPCRRIWQAKDKSGYLFSPRDLELAEYINKLKNIGISSIKIEGRMRSSEYVYRTTKAYRMLVDAKDNEFYDVLKDAKKLLSEDYAREKSTCLFSGRDESLFEINKSQCLGKNIGNIVFVEEDKFGILTNENVRLGDRLRISNANMDKTFVLKLKVLFMKMVFV